jgi:hypothetical protein
MWRQNDAQKFPWNSRSRIYHSQEENVTPSATSRGRPSPMASQLSRLDVKHSQHWPSKGKQRWCRMCSLAKQTRSTLYFCSKCDVGLCIVNCFEKWHTRVNLSQQTQKVALTVVTWGKLYCCTAWTEKICHLNKCCILLCT